MKNNHGKKRKWTRSAKHGKLPFSWRIHSIVWRMRSWATRISYKSERTHSLSFHVFMGWFLLGSKSFFIWRESFLNWSFLERSESDSIKMRMLSLTFSQEILENGFFKLIYAFQTIQHHSYGEKNAFSVVLLIVEYFLVNSKISFKNIEHLLVRFVTYIKLSRYIEKEYWLAPNGFVSVLKNIKFFSHCFLHKKLSS